MKPLLSVVIPVYNGERYLAYALESIRMQFRDGMEVVVADDGSTDGSLEIVRRFAAEIPIRILQAAHSGNWTHASNLGLKAASGEWACFLHQDDMWLPGRVERVWETVHAQASSFILHNSVFIGPDGRVLGRWTCPLEDGMVGRDSFIEHLLVQNFIAMPAPVFQREAALSSGGLDESLWYTADWDLWLRLGAGGPVRMIAEELTAFRVHPESQTMARRPAEGEWRRQLTTVLARHLERWACKETIKKPIRRTAKVSIEVNCALASASRGQFAEAARALLDLLALGPGGWHRFVRDSRIVQRVIPRLKVR
jgi:glycosyltransferase involved in cell wall biosynthesis